MPLPHPEPPSRMTPRGRRLATFAVLLALLAGLATANSLRSVAGSNGSTVSTGPSFSFEQEMLDMLNAERRRRGLSPLRRVATVDNVAREWSDTMARRKKLSHRTGLSTPFTGDWRRLGENVGVGYAASSLHDAFMASRGHRDNVLGDYDHVGVGVALSGTNAWVTVNFVKGDPTTRRTYRTNPVTGYASGAGRSGPFYDIRRSVHARSIASLDDAGVAVSCATYRYCPAEGLRRAEMAEMLVRAFDMPPARERFRDVSDNHPYADAIGALAAAGVTRGCNPPANDRFCPEQVVSRKQMASFLVRALELQPRPEPFGDVPRSNVHARDIGALAATRITRGCNPPNNNRFCPDRSVTRGEMASFVHRALQR